MKVEVWQPTYRNGGIPSIGTARTLADSATVSGMTLSGVLYSRKASTGDVIVVHADEPDKRRAFVATEFGGFDEVEFDYPPDGQFKTKPFKVA